MHELRLFEMLVEPTESAVEMIRFSDDAWHRTGSLREAIHQLPFNTELAAGSLGRERFQTYITQDAIYLGQFSRALAISAAKAPDTPTMQSFAQSALGAIAVEQALHGRYLRDFGVDPAGIADSEPSPDCLAYTSYLIAAAYHEPWEVLAAALLPCFWIYWDVGCAIARTTLPQNPYKAWIDTYADERFGDAVRTAIAITDRAADAATSATRAKMLAAFTRACQYEWLFWDGAYQRRGWPQFG
jgi:thiaminase/transcriptional activator TenA